MITLGEVLKQSSESLVEVSDSANLDVQILLADRMGESRAWVLAHPEAELPESTYQSFQADIGRLIKGVPLPYVLGHWEFYNLDFILTQDTLIPRPETELLVEQASIWLSLHPDKKWAADVGTGSGCIAIALAKSRPGLSVIATDISYPALKVAAENAYRHHVSSQIQFVQSDLLPPLTHPIDLICANLPYIRSDLLPSLEVARSEPELALNGGQNGLTIIGRFVETSARWLSPGGCLFIEIEKSQGLEVQGIARKAFPLSEINILQDLAGYDRLITVQLPGNSSSNEN